MALRVFWTWIRHRKWKYRGVVILWRRRHVFVTFGFAPLSWCFIRTEDDGTYLCTPLFALKFYRYGAA